MKIQNIQKLKATSGIILEQSANNNGNMNIKNSVPDNDSNEKDWENPLDPENSTDSRDEEQFTRQVNEAKRRKNNLTEKDHIDKPKKTNKN